VQNGPNWCKSQCHEVASEFFATNAPDPPPLHSKHMFWCILYYLDVFGTVWLPYKTLCKTGQTGAKVRALKSFRNVSQRTTQSTPLDPNLMFQSVLYYLGAFVTVWFLYNTQYKMSQIFSQLTHPIHRIGLKTNILVCFFYLEAFGTVWLPYKT